MPLGREHARTAARRSHAVPSDAGYGRDGVDAAETEGLRSLSRDRAAPLQARRARREMISVAAG